MFLSGFTDLTLCSVGLTGRSEEPGRCCSGLRGRYYWGCRLQGLNVRFEAFTFLRMPALKRGDPATGYLSRVVREFVAFAAVPEDVPLFKVHQVHGFEGCYPGQFEV